MVKPGRGAPLKIASRPDGFQVPLRIAEELEPEGQELVRGRT